ncbi:hypothetical protein T07_11914 [Trichinella nelsoni]|uniref:MULE transposase domain-containing protein n=1 Tax=Trichinella nelsoni TaxID=6336 RepID=A0A0V0RHA0_9BILA|nr:hypothetical protein T07_11914 [Trichinella nelsoni]
MYHSPTNVILIFANEAGVRLLQLFTIHVFMRGKLLQVVYCLTVRKDLSSYIWIFELLHSKLEELGFQVDPAKFVCDSRQFKQLPCAKMLCFGRSAT